jgi:hypothetical protein
MHTILSQTAPHSLFLVSKTEMIKETPSMYVLITQFYFFKLTRVGIKIEATFITLLAIGL